MTHTLLQIAVAANVALGIIAVVCDSLAVRQIVRQRDDREAMKNFLSPSDRARADMGRAAAVERARTQAKFQTDPKWAARLIAEAERVA